ncbi:MAG: hypothetical protein U5N86_12195 [Planctomycetota bacterium]|nr:hypothetical protein [Planctomycetota bacterium]
MKVENVEDKPFEQVQGKVRRSFMEQKRKNWVENLRAQMKASHVGAKGMLEVYLPQIDW